MNDLYLKYQFTDRAGRGVYNICPLDGLKVQDEILGQIRLHPDKDDNGDLEWIKEQTNED